MYHEVHCKTIRFDLRSECSNVSTSFVYSFSVTTDKWLSVGINSMFCVPVWELWHSRMIQKTPLICTRQHLLRPKFSVLFSLRGISLALNWFLCVYLTDVAIYFYENWRMTLITSANQNHITASLIWNGSVRKDAISKTLNGISIFRYRDAISA